MKWKMVFADLQSSNMLSSQFSHNTAHVHLAQHFIIVGRVDSSGQVIQQIVTAIIMVQIC